MPLHASRAVLRQSRFVIRRPALRNASSTSEAAGNAANAVKEKGAEVKSKASEGLSKVQSSASNVVSQASSAADAAVAKTSGTIGFVSSLIPRVVYYGRVGLELGKIMFEQRSMNPPSLQTFQSYYQNAINSIRGGSIKNAAPSAQSFQPSNILGQIRSMSHAQYASAGVIAAEVIGFFTIGEIIGRMKLVGYRGGKHGEGH
ncbi:mitochondrial F1F0-ATP synthase-like protein g subunit [Pseudovirgaria hyperparasitica]|uniref:Mitochondrial F1F0-ATP synthase-like protein g subunit n=1 Tax=Pseudovirgaria hyperparasitica TaxID=470096 RepID=A0A6A6VR69_9PEZI|nr:mitochondrial F1F0-ATP synthase-like protein g subunit [Pseudovirgaria hyperparasitica]KAF2753168.1 mitochondrial F1F0-ATP synthase-like protein g subunit [Pseudovirgaria hyperparasitica]